MDVSYSQNITNSKSATAKLIIRMFVVDLIIGLAATTKALKIILI